MTSPRCTSHALRLLLAACALFAGLDLHALEFTAPPSTLAPLSGAPAAHGDGCSHRTHVPAVHDAHHCVACKAGAARASGHLPGVALRAERAGAASLAPSSVVCAPAEPQLGTLGARGPPGTQA